MCWPHPSRRSPTRDNVVEYTGFDAEAPWPGPEWQDCTAGRDPRTCLINAQNVVLNSLGRLWVVDAGIAADAATGSDAFDRHGTVRATPTISRDEVGVWSVCPSRVARMPDRRSGPIEGLTTAQA